MKYFMFLTTMFFSMTLLAQRPVKTSMHPSNDFDNFLVPGIGYGAFMTRDGNKIYHGLNTEFTFYTATRPAYKGPGYFRFYGRFNLMTNLDDNNQNLFVYSLGTNLSFEREIKRKGFIPFFGIEMGGISQSDLGGSFQITPLLGINLLSTEHFNWYLQGGYTYATGRNFDQLSGSFLNTGISILFW